MWKYSNPAQIEFDVGSFSKLPKLIDGRRYILVTYCEPFLDELTKQLTSSSCPPALLIRDVASNLDYKLLAVQT